jgi:CubicO group peptidase (beta-lactamase class C family)
LAERHDEIAQRLATLLEEFGVPGAAFTIVRGADEVTATAGVLSRHTGYPVTPDSFFQIGSVTKLFTSTLVWQAVDDGLIDVEAPVSDYLTDFSVGDPDLDGEITIRHLLTHSSGIQGDYFADFGRGDDAVERYVASLAEIGMLHRPGEMFSYCNSGFSVLGRVLEVVRGKSFDAILAERLFGPLGISGGTLPEQALLGRAAVGHVDGPDDGPSVPAAVWALPHASGPAGATPFMDAAGLVAFGKMHLARGLAADGTRILSAESVLEMQRRQREMPGMPGRAMGSSWALETWGSDIVIGHNGGTLGQYTFFRVHPSTGIIAVLMTNGPGAIRLYQALVEPMLAELTGLQPPERPEPPANPPALDLDPAVGVYRHHGVRARVERDGDRLTLTTSPDDPGVLADFAHGETHELIPYRLVDDVAVFVTADQTEGMYMTATFLDSRNQRARYLHSGGRALVRSADES